MMDVRHIEIERMKKLPSLSSDHMCFGAGPANTRGLRMEFYTDNERVYSKVMIPEYMNSWKGLVHGGIVSTVLDETMFYTAMCFFRCIALTKEINIKLHRPARFNQMPFTAVGAVSARKTDTNGVVTGQLYMLNGDLCAESSGVFGLAKTSIIRLLGVLTEQDASMIEVVLEKIRRMNIPMQ